jgi:ribosomal protein S12 methylthiotransferase
MRTLTTTTTTTTTSGTTPPRRRKAPSSSSSSSRRRDHHHHRAISNPENYNDVQKKAAAGKATNESKGEKKKKNARVSLVGLGCPKNVVDAEVMLGDMRKNGYDVTENHEDADAIIINSCGFIDDAKSESVEAILEASKLSGGKKKIVVTGCLAQRYGEDLQKELPEVDLIVGFENYGMLPSLVEESLRERDDESRIVSPFDPASQKRSGSATGTMSKNIITNDDLVLPKKKTLVGGNSPPFRSEIDRVRITPKHSAYLRVAEGCDHKCTFCAIPSFRGKFRSKKFEPIVDEAKALGQLGAKELCLIAEDTNQWGMDLRAQDGRGLAELLETLAEVDGIEWIRILYAYPSYFSDELITAIADVPQVCKYIDIPLQHITNLSLLRMNRPPRQHAEDLLYKLRDRIPGLALRTTFISGFPGETEEEHEELMQFCREFKFERLGAFAYSEEDGTPAAEYPDQVPDDLRALRRDQLVAQQQEISESFAQSRIGQTLDVLIDSFDEDMNAWVGRTSLEAPDIDPVVFVSEEEKEERRLVQRIEPGQMRKCKIVGSSLFDLEAVAL